MKNKITLLLLIGVSLLSAQQKSTGVVTLSTNMAATLTLDNGTSTATLSLTGPNDRWFALQFGSFTGGMAAGSDLVYWDNVTLVDARHVGIGSTPTTDATNNWTITSNLNNSPSAGLRTIVATRAFNTGDANDFTNGTISIQSSLRYDVFCRNFLLTNPIFRIEPFYIKKANIT